MKEPIFIRYNLSPYELQVFKILDKYKNKKVNLYQILDELNWNGNYRTLLYKIIYKFNRLDIFNIEFLYSKVGMRNIIELNIKPKYLTYKLVKYNRYNILWLKVYR